MTAGDGVTRTYTITVGNAGPSTATGVSLTDTWPAGFTRGTITPSQGPACTGSPNFTCALGTIASGGSATVSVTYTVPASTTAGPQVNSASVSATTTDPNTANNTATDSDTVTAGIHHITISPASSTITAGNSVSYTVTAYDTPSHSLGTVTAALSISPNGTCGAASCTATTAGVHTVTATYAGKTATASLTVVGGSAVDVVFGQQPTNTHRNQTISPAVTVRVVDAYGNLVTSGSYLIWIAIGSNPGGGTLSGTQLRFSSGGVATFDNLSINRAGNGYTLATGAIFVGTVTSSSFNITP